MEFINNSYECIKFILDHHHTPEEIADEINAWINNFAISIIDKCIELAQQKEEIRSSKDLLVKSKCPTCAAYQVYSQPVSK